MDAMQSLAFYPPANECILVPSELRSQSMKALVIESPGASFRLLEVPRPIPTAGEVLVRVKASGGGSLEIRLDKPDGPVIGRVAVGQGADWITASVAAKEIPAGVHDLIVTQTGAESVEVDWVSFR